MKRSSYVIIGVVAIAVLAIVGYLKLRPVPVSAPTRPEATPNIPSEENAGKVTLKPVTVRLKTGKEFTLNIPADYTLTVAAEGFQKARFMALSPDHKVWLGEMTSAGDTDTGNVRVLGDFDEAAGKFQSISTALGGLRNPNSVTFHANEYGGWIYIAETDKLVRADYPSLAPDSFRTIAAFPAYGQSPANGGWHLTRTVVEHSTNHYGDEVYVSMGSSCNSCEEKPGELRSMILAMHPADGSNRRIVASGLRNAVGIAFAGDDLYATVNEADHLGPEKPNDVIYKIKDGTDYGWPYCYEWNGAVYKDTSQAWTKDFDCSKVPLAWAELPPHSAPLGLKYVDSDFKDPALRDSILVAMHGSGKPAIGTGYAVAMVREGKAPVDLITGFLSGDTRVARPVDILLRDNSSFFVSDDLNGAVYFLRYRK